jgi:hypothetical protein
MVGENGKVEEEYASQDGSHEEYVFVNTENEKAEHGRNVFHNKEGHIPVTDKKPHQGVDLTGAPINMEDREIGIENGEQNNEENGKQQVMVIEVDKQMGLPIRLPPDRPTAARPHVPAERFCWLLTSVLLRPFVFLELFHHSFLEPS